MKGQALITLLFFVIIGTTITSAAVAILLINSRAASEFEQGTNALAISESGMENALIRILRDPTYTGETLSIGGGTAAITVTQGSSVVATSEGKIGNFSRKVQVNAGYTSGVLTISSWKEIP